MRDSIDITILGGLPVTVDYAYCMAEPDVGIMSGYVDDWQITHVAGRAVKGTPAWIQKRIDGMPAHHVEDAIEDAIAMQGWV